MLKFFKKMKKNRKGYTLTELIVVVAILGVLAAIATPMILNQVGTSRENADKTSAKAIETAVQLCLADGTLKMESDTIKDKNGADALTPTVVMAKLVGNEYPKVHVTDTNKWYLNLKNGKVTNAASDAAPTDCLKLN